MENKKMKNLRDQPLTETKRYKIDVSDIFGKSTAQIIKELKEKHQILYNQTIQLEQEIAHKELILEKEKLYNQIHEKMKSLNIRSCVKMELWEQSIFYKTEELRKMIDWNTDQFNDWFEETL